MKFRKWLKTSSCEMQKVMCTAVNPLYPFTTCALLTPWTSVLQDSVCCFAQKMMPFFPKKNSGQTWSTLSNFVQGKEECLSCTIPKRFVCTYKSSGKKQALQGYENTCIWSIYDVSVVRDISYLGLNELNFVLWDQCSWKESQNQCKDCVLWNQNTLVRKC